MTKLVVALYRYFTRHKAVLYSILTVSTLVFAWFASRVEFEENILALLPKTEKSEECSVAFGSIKQKDKLFIEIVARNNGQSTWELSQAMDDFISIMQEKDSGGYISNVFNGADSDDLMNVVYYLLGALPNHLPESVYPLVDSVLEKGDVEGLMAAGLPSTGSFSFAHGHLFSSDKTIALAFLTPSFNAMDSATGNKCDDMIAASVDEFQSSHPGFEVLYHGAVAESNFNSKQIKKDLVKTVGLSLLVICLILFICLKSRKTILHLVFPIIYGSLFSLACIYWIKGGMSFIAMGIAALVLGVAMSYVLHIIIHHKYVSDMEELLKQEAKPVFLGCLTTIGAFVGLLFTSSELLRDFGIFASLALVGTTFYALVFLPQFFTKDDCSRNEKAFTLVGKLNSLPLDRCKPLIIALCAVIVLCLFTSRKVGFDSDLAHIGYLEPKVVRSANLYNEKVNGSHFSEYLAVNSSDLDSAIFLSKAMYRILDSLRKEGVIYSWSGAENILVTPEDQESNILAWKEFWTPARIDKAYGMLKRYDGEFNLSDGAGMDIPETFKLMAESDYAPQQLYYAGVVPEGLMSNFAEQNEDGWLVFASALMDRDNRWEVCDRLAESSSFVVLDPFYYAGDMVKVMHEDFNVVLAVSSIFVFLVLLLSFKSLILAIIGFMPMFLSWYVVQGIMAIFGIEFNLINIMISTFVFGVGVDYSIFVMEGLISGEKKERDSLLAYHKTAIFFSAVILIIVTASLLFAKHPALYSVGISTIIGMISTILITYVLQPLLFRLIMKSERLKKATLHLK